MEWADPLPNAPYVHTGDHGQRFSEIDLRLPRCMSQRDEDFLVVKHVPSASRDGPNTLATPR